MKKSLWQNLVSVISRHRKRYSAAVAMMVVCNTLLICNPLLLRQAVMAMEVSPGGMALGGWVLALLTVTLIAAIFKYKMRIAFIAIGFQTEADLREELFEKIRQHAALFYQKHPVGNLLSRLTNDLSAYRDTLGPGIMYPLFFATIVIPALIALYSLSVPMALLSTVPVAILPLLMLGLRRAIYTQSVDLQKSLADMSTAAQEHYTGIRAIKAYTAEQSFFRSFSEKCAHFFRLNVWLASVRGTVFPFLSLLTKIVTILLIFLMAYSFYQGWHLLSTADFVSFMWIQSYLFIPVLMLGWVLPIYVQGAAAYERLYDIYHEPPEVVDAKSALDGLIGHPTITFDRLTFSYPGDSLPVLEELSFSISPKSKIGITGPVGAGKSTLVHLLLRQFEVPHGMIFLNNQDIHSFSLGAVKEVFSSVEQDPFLFSLSIEENLRFAAPHASFDDLKWALSCADLWETVQQLPNGIKTVIGERGVMLSGGQKQRLALARAFLVRRPVFLLDDIFSAIDATTEKEIFNNILTIFSESTLVLITHRVSALDQMDTLYTLFEGKLIEQGTPQKLREKGGHYSALVELQNGK